MPGAIMSLATRIKQKADKYADKLNSKLNELDKSQVVAICGAAAAVFVGGMLLLDHQQQAAGQRRAVSHKESYTISEVEPEDARNDGSINTADTSQAKQETEVPSSQPTPQTSSQQTHTPEQTTPPTSSQQTYTPKQTTCTEPKQEYFPNGMPVRDTCGYDPESLARVLRMRGCPYA